MLKKALLIILFVLFASVLQAQEFDPEFEPVPEQEYPAAPKPPEDFFIGINGSVSLYSASGFAYGGGLSIGYGTGSALGLKITWFFSANNIDTLEINLFMRFYFLGNGAYSGPFLEIAGGPAVFFQNGFFHLPAYVGMITGGIGFGWRFVIADRWFIEPFIRGGYPYLVSGSLAAGIRF